VKVFWLDRKTAIDRLRLCAERLLDLHEGIESVGLFGSLAEGTSKPGSDADLLIVLNTQPTEAFHERSEPYQLHFSELGIGVDLFCYSREEIRANPFAAAASASAIWLATRR
jgi:predicted nucleotidyltransferase